MNQIRKLVFPQKSGLWAIYRPCPSQASTDPEGRGSLASRKICFSPGTAGAGSRGALTELPLREEERPHRALGLPGASRQG